MSDDTAAERGRPGGRIVRPAWLVPALAGIALIVGVVLLWHAAVTRVSSGWYAYAPLSGTTFLPDGLVPASEKWGAALIAAAIAVLAWRLGRRAAGAVRNRGRRILVPIFAVVAIVVGGYLVRWAETPLGVFTTPARRYATYTPATGAVTVLWTAWGGWVLGIGAALVAAGVAGLAYSVGRRFAARRAG
jgi:heme/copper-type cytochrome/quinol oxidase subunit 1